MRGRKSLCLLLTFCLAAVMTGCGEEQRQESAAEAVALLEPAGLAGSSEAAARRNLYDADVYSATVVPFVEEYAFGENIILKEFLAFPGETVEKGEVLTVSGTETLDQQIDDLQEQIREMEEEFTEYEAQVRENLAAPQEKVKQLQSILENLEKQKPGEYLPADDETSGSVSGSDQESTGTNQENSGSEQESAGMEQESAALDQEGTETDSEPMPNPAYTQWEQEYNQWNGQYRIASHSVNTMLQQLEQRTGLYELDHAYALQQLAFLQEEKSDITICAGMAGQVVAVGERAYGDYIEGETPIVAVGDPERKLLKCEYINKATAAKAEEIYAVIDGQRYEVTYVPVETEEYTRLTSQGETVYTTFYLEGDTQEVGMGDYAAVVVINRRQEQALSVPKDAVHKDDAGSYVYLVQEKENIRTPVSTGMSDGVYTEILSGIREGDMVLLDTAREYSGERVTVESGSFKSSFSGSGYMTYPSAVTETNPIEHGTVYFQEFETSLYQHVDKGDVIVTVRVAEDEIALRRLNLQVQRQQERLQDLIDQGEEKNQDAIESRRETIAELQKQIAEMQQDYQTTAIRAAQSGIVTWMADLDAEDILQPDCSLIEIADENTCYVIVENTNNALAFGNQVKVTYRDREEQEKETVGMVANADGQALSSALKSSYAYILLPPELIGDMSVGTAGWGGWWNRARFSVTASIREMENVLVVPRRAVKESDGSLYVNVMEEDGSIVRRSFIAGGFDSSNYWVIEGLTEGMELCLE